MFDEIKGPNNQYEGPAVGQTTEKGDSWHTAVAKINGMFKHLFGAVENGIEQVDKDARKAICDLEETVSDLQSKYDALLKIVTATPPVLSPMTESDAEIMASINAAGDKKTIMPVSGAELSTHTSIDPTPPANPLSGFGATPAPDAPAPVPGTVPAPDTAPSSLP